MSERKAPPKMPSTGYERSEEKHPDRPSRGLRPAVDESSLSDIFISINEQLEILWKNLDQHIVKSDLADELPTSARTEAKQQAERILQSISLLNNRLSL